MRLICGLMLGLALLTSSLVGSARAEDGVTIDLADGALKMTVPASWKVVKPRTNIIVTNKIIFKTDGPQI